MKSYNLKHRLVLVCILASLMVGNSGSFLPLTKTIILSISLVVITVLGAGMVYQRFKGTKNRNT
jgi:dolichyl-phosphate-mannose--protein O-mannosyl transferase